MKLLINFLLSFFILISSNAYAETKKPALWEYGFGIASFRAPHYPGSSQKQTRTLGLPYLIYRGNKVKADEDGLRSEFFKNKKWKLDVSFGAAFPAKAKDNKAREGMSNLDFLVEVGPRIRYFFIKEPKKQKLSINSQFRAVLSTTFIQWTHRGFVFHPVLSYSKESIFESNFNFMVRMGSIWGTEKITDYFYQVDPKDVTATRSQFDAKAGFIESHLDFAIAYKITPKARVFIGIQNNFYQNSSNKNSPLLLKDQTQSYGIGFVYKIGESKKRAYSGED